MTQWLMDGNGPRLICRGYTAIDGRGMAHLCAEPQSACGGLLLTPPEQDQSDEAGGEEWECGG